MIKLDEIDRTIVELLMSDGRMSCADIARRIGQVTERTVRYRIERLRKCGVIHIGAIPRPKTLGFEVVADVVIEVEPGHVQAVARQMAAYDCVSYVACSTGDRDISIQVVARDNAELFNFVTEVIGKVLGVRRTTTFLVPMILKDVYEWRIPRSCAVEAKGG